MIILVEPNLSKIDEVYFRFIEGIKKGIKHRRIKAVLSVNSAMIYVYWNLGRVVL